MVKQCRLKIIILTTGGSSALEIMNSLKARNKAGRFPYGKIQPLIIFLKGSFCVSFEKS